MSLWRFLKRWLTGSQEKRTYASDVAAVGLPYVPKEDDRYQLWISLSPREQDVTALTCLGYTNPQIAARLGLSVETVKSYLKIVLVRSASRTKADLRVLFASWDFSEWEKRPDPHRWLD
ncbi:MAG TPA: helix-turn-helix transcriptional regulator [Anaerolineales bacterium]|nr:helix-turn-helix transcriptional regulator [Anaerolineales bacterium]